MITKRNISYKSNKKYVPVKQSSSLKNDSVGISNTPKIAISIVGINTKSTNAKTVLETEDPYIADFVVESGEMLENSTLDMLELEDTGDQETINRIYRAVHSIKGNAGMLGFDNFSVLAHHAENVLSLIRENKVHEIPAVIETSAKEGMISLGRAMVDLVRKKEISLKNATDYALDPGEIKNLLR